MTVLRPINHEDRLSVVDHLDELRTRLFVCLGALLVAFCLCFAFNHPLINALNRALPASPKTGLGDQAHQDASEHNALLGMAHWEIRLAQDFQRAHVQIPGAAAATREIAKYAAQGAKALPRHASDQEKPVVIGPGEGFTTTMTIAGYFAIMFTLPLLLYQIYAFVIPALSHDERKVAVPSMIAAPFLFVAGCLFSYFAIVPPAIHFLQGYNSTEFQVLIGAGSYYKFEILLIMGIGLIFEVPLLLLALQKAGIITASTLTINWRYATVIIAVIAAALPGVDPVTMLLETLPLVLVYIGSIVLLKFVERRNNRRLLAEAKRATRPPGE